MQKLAPFSLPLLQTQASEFAASLEIFLQTYPALEPFIHNRPIDHMAIKAFASSDYENYIKTINQNEVIQLTYTPMNNRRIATALLNEPIGFHRFGQTNVLEIIEPKPEKSGKNNARFDHIEIYNPNFTDIEKTLRRLHITYEPFQNDKHSALVIVINEAGQEIKFTNGNLKEIITSELTTGHAVKIEAGN